MNAVLPIAAAAPSGYWYLTRGTGIVALVLLTGSVALGVANVRRLRTDRIPRFVLDSVHRTVSLLAVAFVSVHIVTSLLDGFAPIRLIDVVVPFTGSYRPVWLGFGALAVDLLLAVTITSLLRRRLGYRAWRLTHWAAYASWPVALLHGLGTGSDTKVGWALALTLGCVVVMLVAVVARATAGWPARYGVRLSALGATAVTPLGLIAWLPNGPLAKGWARRAGTPSYLLVSASPPATAGAARSPVPSFSAVVSGTVRHGESGELALVAIRVTIPGEALNRLEIRIAGQPLAGGGVAMSSSRVMLGPASSPDEFQGHVTALDGGNVQAQLSDRQGRAAVVEARLQLSPAGTAAGTVSVGPGAGR
jgi:sulfoxide reductase heme-binding subunit YedZ